MPAILLLVLTIAAVVALLIYASLAIIRRVHSINISNPHKVLAYLYKPKKKGDTSHENFSYKTEILEAIHMNIKDLKSCVSQLKKEGLILDVDESLALTPLGVDYYEVFIGRFRKAKWPK